MVSRLRVHGRYDRVIVARVDHRSAEYFPNIAMNGMDQRDTNDPSTFYTPKGLYWKRSDPRQVGLFPFLHT